MLETTAARKAMKKMNKQYTYLVIEGAVAAFSKFLSGERTCSSRKIFYFSFHFGGI